MALQTALMVVSNGRHDVSAKGADRGLARNISALIRLNPVEADDYLFIAGGIGITPIRALRNAVLGRRGVRVRMLYLVESSSTATTGNDFTRW